jgi:hypothetical protein
MPVGDRVLDFGLNELDTLCSHVYVCNADPATYSAATTTNALGSKNYGAGNGWGAPAAKAPNGRQVTSVAVTDGTISTTGTASHIAFVDATNSRLLHTQALSATKSVNSGDTFTLNAITLGIPNQ